MSEISAPSLEKAIEAHVWVGNWLRRRQRDALAPLAQLELRARLALVRAPEVPVIVQDASGYVGKPMSIEFQAGLLDQFGPEKAWFKPEAVPIGPRLSALRDETGGQARVFEGTGGIALVDGRCLLLR